MTKRLIRNSPRYSQLVAVLAKRKLKVLAERHPEFFLPENIQDQIRDALVRMEREHRSSNFFTNNKLEKSARKEISEQLDLFLPHLIPAIRREYNENGLPLTQVVIPGNAIPSNQGISTTQDPISIMLIIANRVINDIDSHVSRIVGWPFKKD